MRYPALIAMLAAAAAVTPGKSFQDVEFGKAGAESLRLDGFVPDKPGPHPAVIVVHGGAWVTGDKRYSVQPLFERLSDGGFAWFSINYRLIRGADPASLISPASLTTLTEAIGDVRLAVTFLKEQAAEYKIDPNRFALLGESAGAHLALMAALKPSETSGVKAIVSFYAPSDLVDLIENSARVPAQLRNSVKGTAIEQILISGLRQLSPRFLVHKDAPPMLLIHGTNDQTVPIKQSQVLCDDVRTAGAACELYTVPGGGHGLRWWESQRGAVAYKPVMVRWLAANL